MKKTEVRTSARALYLLCAVSAALCVLLCACGAPPEPVKLKISLTVNCAEAVAAGVREEDAFRQLIPEDGIMFSVTDFEVEQGTTLDSAIATVLGDNGVVFIIRDGYVGAVNGLGEGHMGGASGWLYFVNATVPSSGISEYIVEDGDVIELRYVTDFGEYF